MVDPRAIEEQKRVAAIAAVSEVRPGMIVGIGTGTTVAYAIAELARRVAEGLDIRAVSTSDRTTTAARRVRIPLLPLDDLAAIDLAIDGVDEIDPAFRAIKGGGGAMLREKVVAAMSRRMIAIADGSKRVARLGARPLPIELLPSARGFVGHMATVLGGMPTLRRAGAEVYRTDQGNPILDCRFTEIPDPAALAASLSAIPGLLGHGLFVDEIDELIVGTSDGVMHTRRAGPAA